MNDNESADFKPLVHALSKFIDREVRKHRYSLPQVCGALGAVAGAAVAANFSENLGVIDKMMLRAVGLGFSEVLKAARIEHAKTPTT